MKRIVRLTESDLARIVKRVIREQEEVSDNVEVEIEDMDENDPKALERFIDKVGDGIKKLTKNNKLKRMLKKHASYSPKMRKTAIMCDAYN